MSLRIARSENLNNKLHRMKRVGGSWLNDSITIKTLISTFSIWIPRNYQSKYVDFFLWMKFKTVWRWNVNDLGSCGRYARPQLLKQQSSVTGKITSQWKQLTVFRSSQVSSVGVDLKDVISTVMPTKSQTRRKHLESLTSNRWKASHILYILLICSKWQVCTRFVRNSVCGCRLDTMDTAKFLYTFKVLW